MIALFIALAGSLGGVARFILDGHIRTKASHNFPWATLLINSSGSLLLGMVSGIVLKHHGFTHAEAIIGIGFCGGYTTFSTASFETVRLLEERRYGSAFSNAAGGALLTVAAAALGVAIGLRF